MVEYLVDDEIDDKPQLIQTVAHIELVLLCDEIEVMVIYDEIDDMVEVIVNRHQTLNDDEVVEMVENE